MNNSQIQQAALVLKQGGIIIFPTDTAFGIGCRMDDEAAIIRLFQLRKRPLVQPPPILIASLEKAKEYADVSKTIEDELLSKYWPGALTVILPVRKEINPVLFRDGGIGLRIPNHEVALSLLSQVDVGLLGPSANFHGDPTPFSFAQLDQELIKKVDYILEGECTLRRESTVVSCMETPWKIIRQGALKLPL
jgi:L-threonylcarbamoyladenylate synthase